MFNTKEKRERSLNTKLFLKAYLCNSVKCSMIRNPQRPGLHGKVFRRNPSEFGQQLMEKQKIKASYGLREKSFLKIFKTASKSKAETGSKLLELLERRLDNTVYRAGLAPSRSVARQLVGHGHILVNNKRTTTPSYLLKSGDIVSIRSQSINIGPFKNLANTLKNYDAPAWLLIDRDKLAAKVESNPKDIEHIFDLEKVIDYYSK